MTRSAKYRDMEGWDKLEWQLKYLIPEQKKRWFWIAMARKALTLNRKRIRKQQNLDGSNYAPRADPDEKTKMLLRILGAGKKGDDGKIRGRQTGFRFAGDGILIRAHNPVAAKQHYGLTEDLKSVRDPRYTKERLKQFRRGYREKQNKKTISRTKSGWGKGPITPETEKILKEELGFKKPVWANGGKFRDFTESTAWFIIMEHRVRKGTYPPENQTKLQARDVLGLNPAINAELLKYADVLIEKYRY
jgi:hypothetical protein